MNHPHKHAIQIIGDGSFGSFLRELLAPHSSIVEDEIRADSFILAVPFSAYESVAQDITLRMPDRHLVNVCSIQTTTTNTLLKFSRQVTSIHPLFGRRTPSDKRNSILTHSCGSQNDLAFLESFAKVSNILAAFNGERMTPEIHDKIMAKTHIAAVMAAKQMKVYVDRAEDIPDEFLPNSFRLLKQFVKTLDDMPKGTIESIMANQYF